MKTLEIRHSRVHNSRNAAFCEQKDSAKNKTFQSTELRKCSVLRKRASGKLKIENENFGNKTLQSAELRKCSVLREKKGRGVKIRERRIFKKKNIQERTTTKKRGFRKKG